MAILSLAFKSLMNRKLTFFITIFSIAISVTLLLGVQTLKTETKSSFMKSISGTDLIVGPRGSSTELLLSSVFHIGNSSNLITYGAYQDVKALPAVKWAVPISMGDSHKGYTVVATNLSFFEHFSFANKQHLSLKIGSLDEDMFAVVLGADVAQKLNYKIGDQVVMSHGSGEIEGHAHGNMPYYVSAILDPSFTAIDQSLIISLEGMEAMHNESFAHLAMMSSPALSHSTNSSAEQKLEEHDHDAAHEHHENEHDHDATHEQHHAEHDHDVTHEIHEDEHDHDATHEPHQDEHNHDAAHEQHEDEHDHDATHEQHEDEHDATHEQHEDEHDHDATHGQHEDEHDHDATHEPHQDEHAHLTLTTEQRIAAKLKLKPQKINAVFVGLHARNNVLSVQNYVNKHKSEPLSAVIPAVALLTLWEFFSLAEVALNIVATFVVIVGLLGMLSIILMGLNERRREMAILRSVGARPGHIFVLIIGEAAVVCFAGIALGVALLYILLLAVQTPLANQFGFYLDINMLTTNDLLILALIQGSALLIAIIPALLTYKTTLSDGMSIKF